MRELRERYESLTAREQQVMQEVVSGRLNKQIAAELSISVYTVDSHRSRIMRKLKLRSIGDLVRFAIQRGLIPLTETHCNEG